MAPVKWGEWYAQREVIVLAFYGGLTPTEIANELGLPIGTVRGRMRGGLHKLRVAIEPITAYVVSRKCLDRIGWVQ